MKGEGVQAPSRTPPITEMSLCVELEAPRVILPHTALAFRDSVRGEFPGVSLRNPIQRLGADPIPELMPDDEMNVRWWMISPNGDYLLQVQGNILAWNWRRRSEAGAEPYPGFEIMMNRFDLFFSEWRKFVGIGQEVRVSACSLLYDNTWPLGPEQGIADIFAFWKRLGLHVRQRGPEVRWSVIIDDVQLGETARIDIHASRGVMVENGEPIAAARLQLNAIGYPFEIRIVDGALRKMHDHIHTMLERLVVPEAMEGC